MGFTLFSDVTCFASSIMGVNKGWDANLFARMLHLLHKFVPDLYSVTMFLPISSNTAYSLSGIGRFDKIILPCPHQDGQEQRLSSASIKFLWLRPIHDPSGISPALDNALSTLLSCCSQSFFLSSSLIIRCVVSCIQSSFSKFVLGISRLLTVSLHTGTEYVVK